MPDIDYTLNNSLVIWLVVVEMKKRYEHCYNRTGIPVDDVEIKHFHRTESQYGRLTNLTVEFSNITLKI